MFMYPGKESYMKKIKFTEHGQALILIAFAMVGLVGFAALAIDGGNVFSDRRHSQNASDTSVLAAALERVRRPLEDWKTVAVSRAADNGYSAADGVTEVNVYLCSELPLTVNGYTMTCKGLPAGAHPEEYVYVHIKSIVKLFFAPVIGWRTITNHTDAVAQATLPVPTNMADGYGIWSTHTGCNSPGEGDPFEVGGSGDSEVIGAGVLVGASCPTDDSFVQNGNPLLHTTTGVCVNGTADYDPSEITSDTNPSLREGCPAVDPDTYQIPPAPDCSTAGRLLQTGPGTYTAQPGYYDKTGNRQFPDVTGQVTVRLGKGIYCLYNGINVNAQVTLTTDARDDGFDPGTEGVLIYLPPDRSPNIQFNGGATIDLHAITSSSLANFDDSWFNLLIFVSPDYAADIDISGNSGSSYTGTILAPSAHVHLLGNNGTDAGTVTLDSQIIADTVKISGNTDFTLIYNEDNNITTLTNPDIHLVE